MSTHRMNAELRQALVSAIDGELWDDAYKVRMRMELGHLSDGNEIPYEVSFSFPAADPDADDPLPAVALMIEYFGLEHLVTEVRDFSNFCFCPTPSLDQNDVCRKCGTQWS